MPVVIPSTRDVSLRMAVQALCFIIVGFPFVYFHAISSTFHVNRRGFYCNDENLIHPYVEKESVPMVWAFLIWFIAILITVIPTEYLVNKTRADTCSQSEKVKLFSFYIPTMLTEIYRIFGYILVGGSFCMLFTDLSKYQIGRLRPHFLDLCKPWESESPKVNCTMVDEGGNTFYIYTGDGNNLNDTEICGSLWNKDLDEAHVKETMKRLKEARLSFMSGHSSFSFFCSTFLIIYLQIRVPSIRESKSRRISSLRMIMMVATFFWQFILGILAFWIALTRITDYFHHPMDVVFGSLVGIISASLTLYISELTKKEYVFYEPLIGVTPESNIKSSNSTTTGTQTYSESLDEQTNFRKVESELSSYQLNPKAQTLPGNSLIPPPPQPGKVE